MAEAEAEAEASDLGGANAGSGAGLNCARRLRIDKLGLKHLSGFPFLAIICISTPFVSYKRISQLPLRFLNQMFTMSKQCMLVSQPASIRMGGQFENGF